MSAALISVLIVDDEPPARRKLQRFLADEPGVEVVGEAGSGAQAIEMIRSLRPRVVFLDVQMPKVDGFGVLEAIGAEEMPHVVFVTAFDQYAVQAFDVAAIDYLLKPFDADRFRQALERVRARIQTTGENAAAEADTATPSDLQLRMHDLLERLGRTPSAGASRILVKGRDRSRFVAVDDIRWISAAGNYVELHATDGTHLLRETLDGIAARLGVARFPRVHRSYLVNLDRVKEIQPLTHGDQLLILDDGTEVPLSRRYRDQLPRDVFGDT